MVGVPTGKTLSVSVNWPSGRSRAHAHGPKFCRILV
jgi:hypothetical protein